MQTVGGTGNYLRSEILFFAGLSPTARVADLSAVRLQELARTILAVTRQAYEQAGVTNRAEWAVAARRHGESRRLSRFAVFERDGRPCHACGTPIERRMVASRRLYLCPSCQPD